MTDPMYSGDYLIDPGFPVKQEPGLEPMCSSASVPIPQRRFGDMPDFRDFTFEFGTDMLAGGMDVGCEMISDPGLWYKSESRCDTFKMDEEDIFQVDKADLIQGPTLAELNANDDTLLGDLNFDDLVLPDQRFLNTPSSMNVAPMVHITDSHSQSQCHLSAASFPPAGLSFLREGFNSSSVPSSPLELYLQGGHPSALSPSSHSQHSSSSSILQPALESTPPSTSISPLQMKHSTLHDLLLKKESHTLLGKSVPGRSSPSPLTSTVSPPSPRVHTRPSRLSSSAPTHLGLEQIWQRREPRKHLLSTGSLAEAGSTSSLSTGGVLSPESHDLSQDEGSDSEDESDHYEYEDGSTDADSSDMEGDVRERPPRHHMSKKERYFWQYNVQAKGPKGLRLVLKTKLEDPHVLNEVTDPVFSPSCSVRGIKHSGKARKGDGNDLTPNPRKLQSIGKELGKLGRVINDMTPVSELPFNVRPKTRKEKNKLASRACRLKKKAQHEANKIKLFGLENEHRKLLIGIHQMKQLIVAKVNGDAANREEVNKHIDRAYKTGTKIRIAGNTTDYVNRVLEKVKSGVPDGGIDEF